MNIETRVLALERTARRWRVTAAALSIMVAAVTIMAATQESKGGQTIRAKRIEILDGNRPRIVIDGPTGSIAFLQASGTETLRLPTPAGLPKPVVGRARTKLEARRVMAVGMTEMQVRALLGEPD